MDGNDNNLFEYVKKTKLSDDFRRLEQEEKRTMQTTQGNNCVICLDEFDEPRTLPCKHKFCRVCLQYAIDNSPIDSDSDRGFECILCGHFVKVLNYSIPRSDWADNVPDTKLQHVREPKSVKSTDKKEEKKQKTIEKGESDTDSYRWLLDWKGSTYSKSYFIENGIDPSERTEQGFRLRKITERLDDEDNEHDLVNGSNNNDDRLRNEVQAYHGGEGSRADRSYRKSCITSAVYFNDNIVVYDEGLCEILLYSNDLTLKTSTRQTNVFAIAVLNTDLFMTNPDERCIQVLDLENFRRKESIALTLKCYGISSLGDQLAVLLCDNFDHEFHISFLNIKGIIGGTIHLNKLSSGGNIDFIEPRHLVVCPLTRLAYVSDTKTGTVKSFRLDGHLNWERLVYGAGYLSMYNGYVIVARKFTSSLDVLSGGGIFAGRLESAVYGIEAPSVIAARESDTEIVVVDKNNMLHVFDIRKSRDTKITEDVNSCSCVLV